MTHQVAGPRNLYVAKQCQRGAARWVTEVDVKIVSALGCTGKWKWDAAYSADVSAHGTRHFIVNKTTTTTTCNGDVHK
jgi:hypothetical protein